MFAVIWHQIYSTSLFTARSSARFRSSRAWRSSPRVSTQYLALYTSSFLKLSDQISVTLMINFSFASIFLPLSLQRRAHCFSDFSFWAETHHQKLDFGETGQIYQHASKMQKKNKKIRKVFATKTSKISSTGFTTVVEFVAGLLALF